MKEQNNFKNPKQNSNQKNERDDHQKSEKKKFMPEGNTNPKQDYQKGPHQGGSNRGTPSQIKT